VTISTRYFRADIHLSPPFTGTQAGKGWVGSIPFRSDQALWAEIGAVDLGRRAGDDIGDQTAGAAGGGPAIGAVSGIQIQIA